MDFTIADVLAWARTKPADEFYNFGKPGECALAQFGRATGRNYLVGVGDPHSVGTPKALVFWLALSCTFGELVERLEREVEPSPVKRLWARFRGRTIGGTNFTYATPPISETWTKADAYLNDIEQVSA
jgi:hypothetical protein